MLLLYSELRIVIASEKVEIRILERGKLFTNYIYNLPGGS